MQHWSTEQIRRLLEERDPARLFEQAVSLSRSLGMPYISWTFFSKTPDTRQQITFYNNFPEDWGLLYEKKFLATDPVAHVCRQTTSAVLWDDALFESVPDLREQASAYGLRHGWTQAVHDLHHNESQISVARPERRISITEFYDKSVQIGWLGMTLHRALTEHLSAQRQPLPKLSNRELEILRWSAAGKTAGDIAMILSLSLSTVNFHIRSIIGKTNATNKAAAIAIGVTYGLI